MSENIDELRNMLVTFRVSELQMLLGFAGRSKTGRKTELQQRALELLRIRSYTIQAKIRDLYKTIQQTGALQQIQPPSPATTPSGTPSPNMPQHQGGVPRATVNPYNTRSATLYNQNAASYQQHAYGAYPPVPRIALTQTHMMNQNYPIHPDVEFKRLPFFDVIAELLKPSTLIPQSAARQQECNFYFHLTPQQATDIASSRDVRHGGRAEYTKQIQMRFCLTETSCKQEDFFPPGVVVKVNNKQCPLP
ncbi:PREDICTED: E3 SUMO-protein ligase PIAS3-like, partial [Nicrophorus vespilloides]|uniref:E3 SUMO-protein ligase PIAS3-like n=1 Tax=Nicrophorus vespilloides TaxID=110193 RepID=A0ABM1MMJ9_NICVS